MLVSVSGGSVFDDDDEALDDDEVLDEDVALDDVEDVVGGLMVEEELVLEPDEVEDEDEVALVLVAVDVPCVAEVAKVAEPLVPGALWHAVNAPAANATATHRAATLFMMCPSALVW